MYIVSPCPRFSQGMPVAMSVNVYYMVRVSQAEGDGPEREGLDRGAVFILSLPGLGLDKACQ